MSPSQSELRHRHYDLYKSLLPEMIGRMRWGRPEIEAFQSQALRGLLRHARAHSPWHAARLAGLDLEAPRIALADIPTMGKPDLMANWDDIVTVPGATLAQAQAHLRADSDDLYLWNDHVILASGGTGGSPGVFTYGFEALAANWAMMSRPLLALLAREFGAAKVYRIASIGPGKSAHGSYVMGRVFSNPAQPATIFPIWDTPARILPGLNALDPELVFCNSGFALQLVAGHRQGTLRIDPWLIFFGSEQLPLAVLDQVRAAWPNAHVFTCWGTSEAAGTFPCPVGDGFHVSEDGVIIEPIDEHGQPSRPGELSHAVLLTNLFNTAMPLIRYRVDDVFEFTQAPCRCGLAYRHVKQVHGRSTERFRYGEVLILANVVELAVLEQPIIQEYQVAQTPRGVHIRYSAAGPVDEARMTARVTRELTEVGLVDPEVRIERVDAIERTGMGKLKRFVALPAE